MIKKELLGMKPLNATDKMLKMAVADIPKTKTVKRWGYTMKETRCKYGLFLRCRIENQILKAAIYLPDGMRLGARQPAYEVYIDRRARRFITYDRVNQKWLQAKLDCIEWPGCDVKSDQNWMRPAEEKILNEYLGTCLNGYQAILTYQREIREEELERRHRKETGAWDADMAPTPDLPKDWTRWVDKVGIPQNFVFYDYVKRGADHGYCTYCGKEVQLKEKPRHNKKGRCPRCRHEITYKANGRFTHFSTNTFNIYLIQNRPDGFMVREFWASRNYLKGTEPELRCSEERRLVYSRDLELRQYYWGFYKNRNMRWIRGTPPSSYYGYGYYWYQRCGHSGRIYGKTLQTLPQKDQRLMGLVSWLREKKLNAMPEEYLDILCDVPQVEQIAKAELPQLLHECTMHSSAVRPYIKMRDTGSLTKALGLDAQRLQRLRKYNGGVLQLGWLQYEKSSGRPIPEEILSWFFQEKVSTQTLRFILGKMTAVQIHNYIRRQMRENKMTSNGVLNTWADYLSMAEQLDIDTNDEIIYRVKLLCQRHDELVVRCKQKDSVKQAEETQKKYPKVDKICQSLKKYEYEDQKFTVLAPSGILDIIVEGRMLNHCVDSSQRYWDRIQRHETYILFLRRASAPELPYYTLEVEPNGTVRQTRTKFDRQDDDIGVVKKFLKGWQKVIAERLTKQDRKRAKISSKLRKQEFEQMQKDNVTINVGELAGQRLLDVLTADLMENAA